jgi:beta-glucosidase
MTLDEKIQEVHGFGDKAHFRYVQPVPRLKIPWLNITNGPAGACNGGPGHQGKATALPAPISLAATWDRDAARRYGELAGSEAADLANGLLEGPDVNIVRVPQNGRAFETYGEDPYLAGQLAVQAVLGIQSKGVIANIKHYAGNNQETQRGSESDDVDERTLREIYLPAFEAAVKEGHVGSLMGAYNKINGTYCCENKIILTDILKKDWGFDGFVTSDFGAVHSTIPSAEAGLDLEMPTGKYFGADLEAAVQAGQVPISVIDDKLIRRYRTMIRLGVFDNPPENKPIPVKKDGAQARELAEEGMVLLKNTGNLLPLDAGKLHSIALIGPYAENASTGGGGSSHVSPLYSIKPLDGLQNRVGPKVTVTLSDGKDIDQAAALAKSCDVAIVMVGDYEGEGSDHNISLAGVQDDLVSAVAAANPHTVVVIKSGSPVLMPWVGSAPAIVEAWFPGEEDGNAVAAVLFGDVNPSGKLPVTFPKQVADLPANTPDQYPGVDKVVHYSEGVFVGYRHFDAKKIEPLFPFGYGLSYTTFAYSKLNVGPASIPSSGQKTVTVGFDVSNTGRVAGAEVAQVYVGMPSTPDVPQPPRQLKGFERVKLSPGRKAHVRVVLDARAFSYWDVKSHAWKILPGVYKIEVGSSSRDIRLQGQVTVTE